MIELSEVVSSLEAWEEGKGVIVHGAENTFCSGGDLTLMKDIMNPDKGVTMSRIMQDSLTRLYQLPLLSVALVEGSALGMQFTKRCFSSTELKSFSPATTSVGTQISPMRSATDQPASARNVAR